MRMRSSFEFDFDGVISRLGRNSMDLGRFAMANQMHADMNRYVPMRMGSLRQASYVSNDAKEIVWGMAPYAGPIYAGMPGGHQARNWTTPGTGKHWDKVATRNHAHQWREVFIRGSNI